MSELRTLKVRWVVWATQGVVALLLPVVLQSFWVQLETPIFANGIAAIGLMLLFGRVGQLSLARPFFLAIGAYGYIVVTGPGLTQGSGDGAWRVSSASPRQSFLRR